MSLLRTSVLTAAALVSLTSALLSAPAQAAPQSARIALPGGTPSLAAVSSLSGPTDSAAPISIDISLPLRSRPQLNQLLSDIYDPSSARYGQYLTPQQFAAQYGPTQADYNAVIAWARSQGLTVTGTHPEHTLLGVSGSAATVGAAFGVQLYDFESPSGRIFHAPLSAPTVPSGFSGRISGVIGLDNATERTPNLRRQEPVSVLAGGSTEQGSGPLGGLTPKDLRTVYNLNKTGLDGSGQTLALFELDSYTVKDVLRYERTFGLPIVPLENINVDTTDSSFPRVPGGGTSEVILDIDMQIAFAPRASKVLVYVGPNTGQGSLDTYQQIATENRAKQISTSWGLWEDNEIGADANGTFIVSPSVNAEDQIFLQMAVQGQTIYSAAGDNGGVDRYDASPTAYFAQDPAAQPLMCSVGGTTLTVAKPGVDETYKSETTWNAGSYLAGAGGGGVSIFWGLPSYQKAAATLSHSVSPSVSIYARNVPDVSLVSDPGTGVDVYVTDPATGPNYYTYGGTSDASPMWAGFTALVNQGRAQAGKGPIGFINLALYSFGPGGVNRYTQAGGAVTDHYALDFHDIADGSNNIPYPAIKGYDLATGLGTFNGGNLLNDLVALP